MSYNFYHHFQDIKSPVLSSDILENYVHTNLVADKYDEIPPLVEYDLEDDSEDESENVEDLDFDEDKETERIWNLVDEDLRYIASQNLSKHDNDITKSCASNTPASQADVTSDISPQPDKQSRKGIKVKKFENIRPGAVMPDNIWLSNHMTCSCMSTEEYNNRCKSLSKPCKDSIECNAHISLTNLRAISDGMHTILAQKGNLIGIERRKYILGNMATSM